MSIPRKFSLFQRVLCLFAALLLLPCAQAQPAGDEPVVLTHQHIDIAGHRLDYTAEAGRLAIRDVETGQPLAQMFYTAYRVASKTPRPLAFVWNGGPGAASDTLHFNIAGPLRIEGDHLADNPDTWLTDMDLVFVDPIGTGFSRPLKAEDAAQFYGTVGDVASVTEFVRAWRLRHDADNVPLLLAGESWGAGRAGSVGAALLKRGIAVDGLLLISGGTGLDLDATTRGSLDAWHVVDLVATAHHYGKGRDAGLPLAQAQAHAATWVRDQYLPALAQRDTLSDAQRKDIVAELAGYTGLDAGQIDPKTLHISPRRFRQSLMGGNPMLGLFDMRQASEAPNLAVTAELHYLRRTLGYRTDLPYIGLESLDQGYAANGHLPQSVGDQWNYATIANPSPEVVAAAIKKATTEGGGPPQIGDPLPSTAAAVALNPALKVLVASGLYDSMANCSGYAQLAQQLDAPLRKAIEFRCYPGGHMMYLDPAVRAGFSADVRALARSLQPR